MDLEYPDLQPDLAAVDQQKEKLQWFVFIINKDIIIDCYWLLSLRSKRRSR